MYKFILLLELLASISAQAAIIGQDHLESIQSAKGSQLFEWSAGIGQFGRCNVLKVAKDLFLTGTLCGEKIWSNPPSLEELPEATYEEENSYIAAKIKKIEVFRSIHKLDYALYRIDSAGKPFFEQIPIAKLSKKILLQDTRLNIVGFFAVEKPIYFSRKIDRSDDCKTIRPIDVIKKNLYAHGCDTAMGSGGAPIFDPQTGHVVALNWGVYEKGNFKVNVATAMSRILEDLVQVNPDLYKELTVMDH